VHSSAERFCAGSADGRSAATSPAVSWSGPEMFGTVITTKNSFILFILSQLIELVDGIHL
jgi:hypothetical protein